MTTTKAIQREIHAVLDYLSTAELALYVNPVAMTPTRVTWHSYNPTADFVLTRGHPSVEQYRHWVANGAYSALLRDGSLFQITYDVHNGDVTAHRLAYVPCPFNLDPSLLDEGNSLSDIIGLYTSIDDVALRSPIRIDYDIAAASPGHPASHLTINSDDCRIACIAPMHVHRFVDFVYRNFYPELWNAHRDFFKPAAGRHIGGHSLTDHDRGSLHLSWDIHGVVPV